MTDNTNIIKTDRGEREFKNMPILGVKVYKYIVAGEYTKQRTKEIVAEISADTPVGRVLDIGCGPADQLIELRNQRFDIELFGIDISARMISIAKRTIPDNKVTLSNTSLLDSDFESNFFSTVFCCGSFYLWNQPLECLNEIYRILKPGRSAYLFETYKDRDQDKYNTAFRENCKTQSFIRNRISAYFLNRQNRMTYKRSEIVKLIEQSEFSESFEIDEITLGNLPMWLRIKLSKRNSENSLS